MVQDRATRTVILLALIGGGIVIGEMIAARPDMAVAFLSAGAVALVSFIVISRSHLDRQFVLRLWLVAIGLRVLAALGSYFMDLRGNIAPDYDTYDYFGNVLCQFWQSDGDELSWILRWANYGRSGWGMYYYVAAVYYVIGQNTFALQLLSAVLGANASVLIYHIAWTGYSERRVARVAAVLTAFAPSMLIWTSQGIKEPLILFALCAALLLTLRMSRRITIVESALLLASFFSLYALRHYVFYIVFLASAAALLFSAKRFSPARIMQGSMLMLVLGMVFSYYGADRVAQRNLNLERIQSGREWSGRVTGSSYGSNVDITDTRQALLYLPLGTVMFLFAPFPWMVRNANHVMLMPEMVLWWMAAPFLLAGFWYAFRHRLRETLPILLYTAGLTFAYALYLTNFGTAHRMRVQVLGFLIIFISIGWVRWRSRKAEQRTVAAAMRNRWQRMTPVVAPAVRGK